MFISEHLVRALPGRCGAERRHAGRGGDVGAVPRAAPARARAAVRRRRQRHTHRHA